MDAERRIRHAVLRETVVFSFFNSLPLFWPGGDALANPRVGIECPGRAACLTIDVPACFWRKEKPRTDRRRRFKAIQAKSKHRARGLSAIPRGAGAGEGVTRNSARRVNRARRNTPDFKGIQGKSSLPENAGYWMTHTRTFPQPPPEVDRRTAHGKFKPFKPFQAWRGGMRGEFLARDGSSKDGDSSNVASPLML